MTDEIVEDVVETPTEEVEVTEETEVVENTEQEGGEGEPEEVEAWQLEEDHANEEEGETVPLKVLLKTKRKLKDRLGDKDTELERLKEENARLKQVGPETKTGQPVRPNELDYETDEEYSAALVKYEDDSFEYRLSQRDANNSATQAQNDIRASIRAGVEEHDIRAEALLKTSGITAEKYALSDQAFRSTIESVMPGNGDLIADMLITKMGPGSEKVAYHLGVNKAAQTEFRELLRKDPSGIEAGMYLGEKKRTLAAPAKRKSNAPAPAQQVNGSLATDSSAKFKKEYDAAHKSGNYGKAFDLKREARKTHKIDTSKW